MHRTNSTTQKRSLVNFWLPSSLTPDFCPSVRLFFAKFLTSEPRRKFSTHVMVVFWVPYAFSQITAIQHTLNLGDTTSRKYSAPIFEKTVTSPAF